MATSILFIFILIAIFLIASPDSCQKQVFKEWQQEWLIGVRFYKWLLLGEFFSKIMAATYRSKKDCIGMCDNTSDCHQSSNGMWTVIFSSSSKTGGLRILLWFLPPFSCLRKKVHDRASVWDFSCSFFNPTTWHTKFKFTGSTAYADHWKRRKNKIIIICFSILDYISVEN